MNTIIGPEWLPSIALLLHSIGIEIVVLLLKAAILLVIALWSVSQLQRSSAEVRHLSWSCFFLSLSLLPFISQITPSIDFVLADYHAIPIDLQINSLLSGSPIATTVIAASSATGESASQVMQGSISIYALFALFYFLMVAIKVVKYSASLVSLHLVCKRSESILLLRNGWRKIAVNVSRDVRSPMTCGYFRPVVLLPACAAQWQSTSLNMVLAHELAHIKRHDWLVQTLSKYIEILFFPLPGIQTASRQLHLEAESSVDDQVLNTGNTSIDYAATLVTIAQSPAANPDAKRYVQPKLSRKLRKRLNQQLSRYLCSTDQAEYECAVAIIGRGSECELTTRINRIVEPIAVRDNLHSGDKLLSICFTLFFVTALAIPQPTAQLTDSQLNAKPVIQNTAQSTHLATEPVNARDDRYATAIDEEQKDAIADIRSLINATREPQDRLRHNPLFANQADRPLAALFIEDLNTDGLTHQDIRPLPEPQRLHLSVDKNIEPAPQDTMTPHYQQAVAIKPVLPVYPKHAVRKEIEGTVHATYTVNESGKAENIRIVYASPTAVFDRSVIKAISKSIYQGSKREATGSAPVIYRQEYTFQLSDKRRRLANLMHRPQRLNSS